MMNTKDDNKLSISIQLIQKIVKENNKFCKVSEYYKILLDFLQKMEFYIDNEKNDK